VQQIKPNQEKPIDLVKDFYDQDIDHKALEKALTQRKNTAKGFTNFSLDTYTGEFGDAEKKHLLNRTMVGYCHRHHKDLDGLSLEESIDLIFQEDEFIEPTNIYYHITTAEEYKQKYVTEDVDPNEPFLHRSTTPKGPNGDEERWGWERRRALLWSVYGSIYNQLTSIHWKLFLFLHNLTPVIRDVAQGYKGNYNYINLLFKSCFTRYDDFIYNLTFNGSMLEYLNLRLSLKETPDENYAREVQELFTVGKRPFAKFTEKDVREAARLLTGCNEDTWNLVLEEGYEPRPIFNDWNHDSGDKYFSSFYGNRIIKGREGKEGIEEVREFVDMICGTEEHSIFIVRRLYQFFVYPALTPEIEQNIILPLSRVYKDSGYLLAEPLKILLKSEHFYLNNIQNSLIKSPVDFYMTLLKEVDSINNSILFHWNNNEQQSYNSLFSPNYFGEMEKDISYIKYKATENIDYFTSILGLEFMVPPSVSGWPAYYQEPVYDLFWINSSTLPNRIRVLNEVMRNGMWLNVIYNDGNGVQNRYNLKTLLNTFESPKNIELFVNELVFRFLGGEPSNSLRQKISQALLNNINENHWEEEISNILDQDTPNKASYDSIYWRLGNAFEVLGTAGEFHLF